MKKVIAVVGPTAVGKSALGLKLAQKFNGEIISGDSMQIYRGLDIGTAKDSKEELSQVPHHLVDISDVTDRYTVKDFQSKAIQIIDNLSQENKNSFVVGGTGFYLNSLVENMNLGGVAEGNDELRKELLDVENKSGINGLIEILKNEDPQSMELIDLANPRRIIRAIEIHRITGESMSNQRDGNKWAKFYLIGLTDDRAKLYDRINKRVDKMVDMGLLDEVRPIYDNRDQIPQAKNGIGYKELFPYFEGEADLKSCLEEIKKNSRHFAKRQLTYFRNQMDVDWYNISDEPDYQSKIESKITNFLGGYDE
ncbi:tRNA (adenosine(37)-N6)-dimethylallyltransferase MiaA [Companilactobacillus allii]|uniref:tRNA dimethylallyltransferase n=1 Tax=Companilactobacillus allii TaxID=1847728 RepID=A0A1P8Q3Y3_9LACO|nr:tRNA (adenosine(37)-N6)-dimethylallyltransferase MiaA [Companilactobacillus allii]APX72565.1 tRNA (adenosine(37)-N6)-dimethylallyltransferase MiaA [Companilactobacillus allii]USQ69667.1 tRNA (adenosine(37)-N6)-dimethylallyltransferase MiaA [Companilactobacillus allii]